MRKQLLILTLVWATSPAAYSQSTGGEFAVTGSTIDNGGTRSESAAGEFVLAGTIGQFDATEQIAVGGLFTLSGGFWSAGMPTPPGETIFSDGFESLISKPAVLSP